MKKHSDQDLLGITFPLFDYRSGAFRQKMLNHFQSNGRKLWTDIEIMQGKKKYGPVIFSKENAWRTADVCNDPTTAMLFPHSLS